MKKTLSILLLLFSLLLSTHAQTESKRDSLSIDLEQPLDRFDDLQNAQSTLETEKSVNNLSVEELERRKIFVKTLHFITPEFYVGPPTENKPYGRILPAINDYAFYDSHQLADDVSLSTASVQSAYSGIGAIRRVDASLHYQVSDWLSISGGVYGAKYNLYGNHFNNLGFSTAFRLKVHERIYLKGFAGYSINAQGNNRGLPQAGRGLFPSTYFGGGVEVKVTQKFGLEGGMKRELNTFTGKWENTPYFAPTFYLFGR